MKRTEGRGAVDPENHVVRLCVRGMGAEARGEEDEARRLFLQAWDEATDDYEACIAAHYVARHQTTPQDTLRGTGSAWTGPTEWGMNAYVASTRPCTRTWARAPRARRDDRRTRVLRAGCRTGT